jgi:hypothetical protein
MAQKVTLSAYLEQRGKKAKALTKIEAGVFGIPYPLLAGWPRRHGGMEITDAMIERVEVLASAAAQSTDRNARQGGKRATAAVTTPAPKGECQQGLRPPQMAVAIDRPSTIPGFVLRQARRYRARKQPPWT